MTASPIEVSNAAQAYRQAWDWLKLTWDSAKFMDHLNELKLVDYNNGVFIFEAPTQRAVDLLNRNSERHTLQNAIAVYMPADIQVRVEVVLA